MFSQPSRSIGRGALSILLVAFNLIWAGDVRGDDASEARNQYQKATAHFAVGEYREAASAYEAAFKLKQDPALLYNAAQSHRLGGDKSKALLLYRNLVKLYPTSTYAADSQQHVDKLEQEGTTVEAGGSPGNVIPPAAPAQGAAVATPPPTPSAISMPPSGAPASPPNLAALPLSPPPPVAPAPPSEPPSLLATSMPTAEVEQSRSPIYKRWWFWATAGAVVAGTVVATVVAVSGGKAWATNPDVHGAP